ncbi:Flagellar hook-length control protein FliK [Cupriavidus taiwanensis]|uniref:flagellar hook-length control protein FliK n=1 Tax=Cupriavidus taiwanensis TaxID=164546 RepID=UPI000E12AB43|nr:flagellar hook-length control protein FliK [Cupriavidus taiwanensis]SOZ18720.1 Flagellar hook-length control protein FliK [Cupriavidus taiwanensis]SOZ31954.1 Flagellar hook-length control protein FliK [Cupriavidus taiwanensis]SOZ47634.1 Flagellar hook-length control protein FliK [Cupriavidus taiwanensis]
MTGIHLPPGLAPGQAPDPQALRTAIAVDQVAALQPVAEATESNVHNASGQAIRHSALASGPNAMAGQGALLPGASTQESLSAAARAILAVMDGAEAQPVRSNASLLPAAPTAASAPATAAALANAVGHSGLFYESHLAQWVAGARGLASLRQEPQAQVPVPGRPAVPAGASQGAAAAPPSLQLQLAYAGSSAGAEPAWPSMPPLLPASQVLAEALASAGNPRVAHSHAAAEQALRQGTATTAAYSRGAAEPAAQRPSAATLATQAYQSTAEAGARLAALDSLASQAARASDGGTPSAPADAGRAAPAAGPAIHPATEGVVRQQLELLATQQFRFAGEAWPGVPIEWELLRAEADATASQGEAARPWSSRLRLQLPNLGVVEAVLTLGPGGLDARVATPETDVAARFIAARPQLRSQLEAHGIAVQRLSVQTQDSLAQGGTQ